MSAWFLLDKANLYLKQLYFWLLDFLFPKQCFICGQLGTVLCESCLGNILFVKFPTCFYCGAHTPRGQLCSLCRQKSFLTGLIVAAHYEEGPLKELIHQFKYSFKTVLMESLAKMLNFGLALRGWGKEAVLVPVPLHPKKAWQRGFNQSYLLAKALAELRGMPVVNALKRIKEKKPQIVLSGRKRRQNLKNVFNLSSHFFKVEGKVVLLVDDVATTGTTLEECAKLLREAGAREVWGLVLAKA